MRVGIPCSTHVGLRALTHEAMDSYAMPATLVRHIAMFWARLAERNSGGGVAFGPPFGEGSRETRSFLVGSLCAKSFTISLSSLADGCAPPAVRSRHAHSDS